MTELSVCSRQYANSEQRNWDIQNSGLPFHFITPTCVRWWRELSLMKADFMGNVGFSVADICEGLKERKCLKCFDRCVSCESFNDSEVANSFPCPNSRKPPD